MLTLDPILQAAQDGQVRNPIIKIVSSSYLADIPFDGQKFNDLAAPESKPNIVATTTGRILGTILRSGDIYMLATDINRIEWKETLLVSAGTVLTACPVELDDGTIGVVYVDGAYTAKSITVNQDGTEKSSPVTLFSYPGTHWIGDIHVSKQSDAYRIVFSYRDSSATYVIMCASSIDFITWSTPSLVSVSGLSNTRRYGNPSLIQSSQSAELFLFFDYVDSISGDGSEVINIYYQVSTDLGATWGTPVKATAYTQSGNVGYHPSAAERPDGTIELAWTEKNNVLHVDKYTDGYQSCGISNLCGTDFHYDAARNKLLIKSIDYSKHLKSVIVMDIATWTIDKCYTPSTIPAYNQIFCDKNVWDHRWHDTGQYVCAGTMSTDGHNAMVIDTIADTAKTYRFISDHDDYGLVKNVDTNFDNSTTTWLQGGYLDSDTKRLYLIFINPYVWTHIFYLGYIDILEEPDGITGKYTWHQILSSNLLPESELAGFNHISIIPSINCAMVSFEKASTSYIGRLLLINLSSGGIVKDYYNPTNPGFHRGGIYCPCYYDNKIYGGFAYMDTYDMQDRRGLMIIDLGSDTVTYQRPTYATKDNYSFSQMDPTGDDRILIGTQYDGVVLYDIENQTWERINNAALPGLTPNAVDDLASVAYDPTTGTIFAGSYSAYDSWSGVSAFSIYGAFYQGQYKTGELTEAWAWSEEKQLTLGHFDKENSICINPDDGLWSLWTQTDKTEQSAVWDREAGSSDLTRYLVNGTAATINWSVESPNSLSFYLSHGHLFDPQNQMSTLSPTVAMGRPIAVRIGERIGDVDFWQNQGTFIVKDAKLTYSRGNYPTIQITCEDISAIWEQGTIVATEDYDDATPNAILQDLVTQYGVVDLANVDIPEIANSHNLYHQFIDQTLSDCIKIILDHFGYFPRIDVDNKFAPRPIDLSAAVSHAYLNSDALVNYTPDNSYATFTNRVVVTGEGNYFIEVLYDEESVGTITGTIGWWGEKQAKKVYYSDDHTRVCRNPRLEVVQSVEDFWLFKYMGGGTEGITDTDYYENWVEITIEGPDLTGVIISEIAAVTAIGINAIHCYLACGPYLFAMSVSVSVLFYTLACFAAYSYNIFARPMGREKQTIQAQADDTQMQQQINGQIVETTIDDPLCYEVEHCQRVADLELSVVQAQRNRVKFDKVAHLQDEVGDVISIVHPFSGVTKKVFITDLQRSYTKPDSAISQSGGVFDSISGWIV